MILNDITQRRLESYQALLIEKGSEVRAAATFNRIIVEAAVESGIAEGVPDSLLDLTPRAVKAMTDRIAKHIKLATEPLSGE